jgi:hypothetical protein
MGSHIRETTAPSRMTREQLETLIVGQCDHRLAAIEERVAALERRSDERDQRTVQQECA